MDNIFSGRNNNSSIKINNYNMYFIGNIFKSSLLLVSGVCFCRTYSYYYISGVKNVCRMCAANYNYNNLP